MTATLMHTFLYYRKRICVQACGSLPEQPRPLVSLEELAFGAFVLYG